ncbi:SDR family NAD(P)-dependent oxidoreductase [Aeromicrobium endophyticum]|uniref:SDR family NAD(P)-dependent oxidoreductase n=1 Tax=Aeromicrobium endophyticum TaxID=2292704 RepID=A0A371NYV4_9ACTN|nr:SDR family NAD(P)-dependent oxidoreductase [Aeromicrobium endophyticum]REK68873.1 SDR family NAD(P)-dependent oxidoreductase [Aeromicrobium endophyticum]
MTHDHTASDLTDRTVLITGATSGIGRATATAVAARGARVVLAVRDTAKGRTVADMLAPASRPHVVRELDLANLASVRRFSAETSEPIDVLVNNAGVSSSTLQHTKDGFELQIGTNHVGHFVLTTLLLPQVTCRVVTLASQAERMSRLDLDDLSWQRRPYDGGRAYADSKLANLLFTLELDRRLRDAASPVRAMAAHPGLVVTAMYDRPAGQKPGLWDRLMPIIGQSPEAGALPVLHAATAELPSGTFTGPRHLFHMRGGAQVINRSARARDLDLAARLWATTEKLVATNRQ